MREKLIASTRRWALTPPFHLYGARSFVTARLSARSDSVARTLPLAFRLALTQSLRCLFSVALSIAYACHTPPVLNKRVLCPVESGLSSTFR